MNCSTGSCRRCQGGRRGLPGRALRRGLAEAMPEAQVLGFDDYARYRGPAGCGRWRASAGQRTSPGPRRAAPDFAAARPRQAAAGLPGAAVPAAARDRSAIPDLPAGRGPASGPRVLRRRLGGGVVAPLKIASGCDRRCSFCAIPAFRGAFVSRPPGRPRGRGGLAGRPRRPRAAAGQRELDVLRQGPGRPEAAGDAAAANWRRCRASSRVRVSYLQPAEVRPGLVERDGRHSRAWPPTSTCPSSTPAGACCGRCAGSVTASDSARCSDQIRQACPGGRGPVQLHRRLPRRDRGRPGGVAGLPGRGAPGRDRRLRVLRRGRNRGSLSARPASRPTRSPGGSRTLADLADELMAQRAAERIGEVMEVLIEESLGGGRYSGRAAHQAPEVDGTTEVSSGAPLAAGHGDPGQGHRCRWR